MVLSYFLSTLPQLGDLWIDGDFESRQELQKLVFPSGIFLDKGNCNYRTISLSQMSKGKLACTLPWREIEGKANERERGIQGYALVFKQLQKCKRKRDNRKCSFVAFPFTRCRLSLRIIEQIHRGL